VPFTIPEFGKEIARRRYLYYLKDVNSNRLTVDMVGPRLRLTLGFESSGSELEGRCLRKGVFHHWDHDCFVGGDKGAPDGNINRAQIQVLLPLIPFQGSVSYGPVSLADIRFDADIQLGGICKVGSHISGGDLCEVAFHYRRLIHDAVTK